MKPLAQHIQESLENKQNSETNEVLKTHMPEEEKEKPSADTDGL